MQKLNDALSFIYSSRIDLQRCFSSSVSDESWIWANEYGIEYSEIQRILVYFLLKNR